MGVLQVFFFFSFFFFPGFPGFFFFLSFFFGFSAWLGSLLCGLGFVVVAPSPSLRVLFGVFGVFGRLLFCGARCFSWCSVGDLVFGIVLPRGFCRFPGLLAFLFFVVFLEGHLLVVVFFFFCFSLVVFAYAFGFSF